jgi:hypothetical protein
MNSREDNFSSTCPSAQPGMVDAQILGVITGPAEKPRVAYLNEQLPATDELLASSGALPPTRIFRLAARCEEKKCMHFDGEKCQLATRIVHMLPVVSKSLPACTIRPTCRWFTQEGKAACLRCSQILTYNANPTEKVSLISSGTV